MKRKARRTYKPFRGGELAPGEMRVTLVKNSTDSFPEICFEAEMPEEETPLEKLRRYLRKCEEESK